MEFSAVNEFVIPSPKEGGANVDMDCFEMALVSLAYVKLQLNDSAGTLEITQRILTPGSKDGSKESSYANTASSLRMREMAEIYSREATTHV